MMFIVWGLALFVVIFIIAFVALKSKDTKTIDIDVERPWKFRIKISMDKSSHTSSNDKNT